MCGLCYQGSLPDAEAVGQWRQVVAFDGDARKGGWELTCDEPKLRLGGRGLVNEQSGRGNLFEGESATTG